MNGTHTNNATPVRSTRDLILQGGCPTYLEIWLDKLASQTDFCPPTHQHPSHIGFTVTNASSDPAEPGTLNLTLRFRTPEDTAGTHASGFAPNSRPSFHRRNSISAGVAFASTAGLRNTVSDWEESVFERCRRFPNLPPHPTTWTQEADSIGINPFCHLLPASAGATEIDAPSGRVDSVVWALSACPSGTSGQWELKLRVD